MKDYTASSVHLHNSKVHHEEQQKKNKWENANAYERLCSEGTMSSDISFKDIGRSLKEFYTEKQQKEPRSFADCVDRLKELELVWVSSGPLIESDFVDLISSMLDQSRREVTLMFKKSK